MVLQSWPGSTTEAIDKACRASHTRSGRTPHLAGANPGGVSPDRVAGDRSQPGGMSGEPASRSGVTSPVGRTRYSQVWCHPQGSVDTGNNVTGVCSQPRASPRPHGRSRHAGSPNRLSWPPSSSNVGSSWIQEPASIGVGSKLGDTWRLTRASSGRSANRRSRLGPPRGQGRRSRGLLLAIIPPFVSVYEAR
jgi:hypothetical protein